MPDPDKPADKQSSRSIIRDILIAIISAVIGSYTSCATQRSMIQVEREKLQFEQTKLDSEKKKFEIQVTHESELKQAEIEAKQQSEAGAIKKEHQEKELLRLTESQSNIAKLSNDLQGKYYRIQIKNDCDSTAQLAFRYYALDGTIHVEGWHELKPGATGGPWIFTATDWFQFYGETDSGLKWQGDHRADVTNQVFEYIDDYYFRSGWFPLPDSYEVSFREIHISSPPFQDFVQPITCKQPDR